MEHQDTDRMVPPKAKFDIFISYAHSTAQTATRQLRDQLVGHGLEVFLDEREISFGSPFPRDIADALLDSRLFIVFADESYFQRPWCVYEFQVITAPYRSAAEPADTQLEYAVVALPTTGDLDAILSHLPPPLAKVSWPTAERTADIVSMIQARLVQLKLSLRERLAEVNDDAVERLRAGGGIPLAWAKRPVPLQATIQRVELSSPFYLDLAPESRGEEFIGRAADLWRVFHALVTCRVFREAPACAVQGLGGSGKTQIAAEFVARYGRKFFPGGVIWINAESGREALVGQFRNVLQTVAPDTLKAMADAEEHSQLAAMIANHFSTHQSRDDVLWVIDAVPEPSGERPKSIDYWCPAFNHVTVLATSRRIGLERMTAHIDLGGLPTASAVAYLTRPPVDRNWLLDDEWADLTEWIGGLPLAMAVLRESLMDGFTTAQVLKVARHQEPSVVLDREMDELRGEVADERLRGITEAFDFSYRAISENDDLRHAAHLMARLAPYPLSETLLAYLIPTPLIGRLSKRCWIFSIAGTHTGPRVRRWNMHRIPASFLRVRSPDPGREFTGLFHWLDRLVTSNLGDNDTRALSYHLMVIQRGLLQLSPATIQTMPAAIAAAQAFATNAVATSLERKEARGLRFLAAELASALGAGDELAARLEQAYDTGSTETAVALPHTLQAVTNNSRAVALMERLLQDPRDEVRWQALIHAPSLRALDLAVPLLQAIIHEPNETVSKNAVLGYDVYLDNRCPALRDILSHLAHYLNKDISSEREAAAALLGRVLLVNGKNLSAGGFSSRNVVGGLMRVALQDENEEVVQTAILAAGTFFDAEAYQTLTSALAQAQDSGQRARLLGLLGDYLEATRRPPPPKGHAEMIDSGGVRIEVDFGRKIEPLPDYAYQPVIEAALATDLHCVQIAVNALLRTIEGKKAAGDAAHALLDQRAFKSVKALADALISQAPDFTNAYWWRGQARRGQGEDDDALSDFTAVIEQMPDFPDAFVSRAQVRCARQEFSAALPDLERAAALDPKLFAAHHLASLCLYNLGRYEEAVAAADRAIALAPQVGEAWLFRSVARYAAGKTVEALADVRHAVALAPGDERAVKFKTELEAYLAGPKG